MTDQPATAGDAAIELPIDFLGREMYVHMPSPEQLLVWRRVLTRLQQVETAELTGMEVLNALERFRLIIDSLLANHKDVDFIDDEMLAGRVGIKELAPLITKAVEAFQTNAEATGNRATRRAAAKKATPARRKPPAPRTRKATAK
jgi:hypothetical protein